jgi:SPP1 family predicted phage head-tail adaptor
MSVSSNMTLLASELRERVTFQRELLVSDNIGGGVRAYEDVVSVWAQVMATSAGDNASDVGIEVITHFKLRMRYRDDITASMRVLWDGKILTIASVIDVLARHEILELNLREGGV